MDRKNLEERIRELEEEKRELDFKLDEELRTKRRIFIMERGEKRENLLKITEEKIKYLRREKGLVANKLWKKRNPEKLLKYLENKKTPKNTSEEKIREIIKKPTSSFEEQNPCFVDELKERVKKLEEELKNLKENLVLKHTIDIVLKKE